MERKSIGQFIMALRKAAGMTQKQLAERLNVSDKAVSRWERDENAPDIALIPVLAEIFGVTSDEILLGERKPKQDAIDATEMHNARLEKQIDRALNSTYTRFSICSTVSIGIGGLGLLVAMICNYGFYRAYLGFFLASALYLSAATMETIFIRLAYSSLEGSELACEKRNRLRRKIFHFSCWVYAAIFVLFFISLPLLSLPWDANMGVTFSSWFAHGLLCLAVSIPVCFILSWAANRLAVSRHIYALSEEEEKDHEKAGHLRKRFLIILVMLLLITAAGQAAYNVYTPRPFFIGKTYTDFDEFKAYIEAPPEKEIKTGEAGEAGAKPWANDATYYDEQGNEISEEEALTHYIYSADKEKVVGQYIHRNWDVVQVDYRWKGDRLEIVTYTGAEAQQKYHMLQLVNNLWIILYFAEALCVAVVYYRKKANLLRASK